MNQNSNKVNKFWKDYYEAVVESGIPEKTAELYANWAQKFAIAIKERHLRSRVPEDVYSFLADLETQKGFEAWQEDMISEQCRNFWGIPMFRPQ